MTSLTATAGYSGGSAYGTSVEDLQKDIFIENDIVNGTLKYVADFSKAGFRDAEKSGNFLALQFEAPEDATVKTKVIGGVHGEIELKSGDRSCVYRITDKAKQSIQVSVEKEGHKKVYTYALTGLTLEGKPVE